MKALFDSVIFLLDDKSKHEHDPALAARATNLKDKVSEFYKANKRGIDALNDPSTDYPPFPAELGEQGAAESTGGPVPVLDPPEGQSVAPVVEKTKKNTDDKPDKVN